MDFPLTSVLDDFNRGDGNVGVEWVTPSQDGGVQGVIVSNQLAAVSAGEAAVTSAQSFGPDAEVFTDVPVLPGAGVQMECAVRTNNLFSPTQYKLKITANTGLWEFRYRLAAASVLIVAGPTQVLSAGDGFGMRVIDTGLEAWYKPAAGIWTQLFTTTDSNVTKTATPNYIAVHMYDTTTRLDNVGGGSLEEFVFEPYKASSSTRFGPF